MTRREGKMVYLNLSHLVWCDRNFRCCFRQRVLMFDWTLG
jgi:hypothetical protein